MRLQTCRAIPMKATDPCTSEVDFHGILPADGIVEGTLHLQKILRSQEGMAMHVDVELLIYTGNLLGTTEAVEILSRCCRDYCEYAISTPRDKTCVLLLDDGKGNCVGDVILTFRVMESSVHGGSN